MSWKSPSLWWQLVYVSVGLVAAVIIAFAIYMWWPYAPSFRDYITDTRVLRGSTVIYQYRVHTIETAVPGNDSSVHTILKVDGATIKNMLSQASIFKDCAKDTFACTKSPTWRPHQDFVNPNGPNFQEANLKSLPVVLAAYLAIASDTATRCTARDYVDKGYNFPTPNRTLICVSPSTGYMSLEYLSGSDTKRLD